MSSPPQPDRGRLVPLSAPVALPVPVPAPVPVPGPATGGRAMGAVGVPAPLTPLIGRKREAAALRALLRRADVRLVTLTGPGGVGKTRLALKVAADLADDSAGGAVVVALAPVRDPALVAPTVAGALRVEVGNDQLLVEALAERLGGEPRLLVLDNFEHVLAAAGLVAELLTACPGLTVLATSRARLRLSGEHAVAVPPLAVPEPGAAPAPERLTDYAAVQLFVERARAVDPGFALSEANAAAVAAVCRRLEGLPLALELAAARTRVLSPAALAARLTDRLGLLTGGPRDAPARLRTMRDAIAWSDGLLSAAERALFRRVAVFVGGFTIEAAEAVARQGGEDSGSREERDRSSTPRHPEPPSPRVPATASPPRRLSSPTPLDLLEALLDASLLRREVGDDGAPRFWMLETVREYGLERLASSGEEAATREAHAAWCLALVERVAPELAGPEPGPWLDRLETEHDNLRAALQWAMAQGEADLGLRMAGDLWRFWRHRGHWTEGRAWLERTLALGDGAPAAAQAKALNGAGVFADDQGDYDQAVARYEEALALFRALGDRQGAAGTLSNRGDVARLQGDYDRALALYEEALALYREIGATRWVGFSLNALGVLAIDQGDVDRAASRYEEALTVFRALGHRPQTADVLTNLGVVAQARRDYRRSAALAAEALATYRELGDSRGMALTLFNLGAVALDEGDWGRAVVAFQESLAFNRELGDRLRLAQVLDALGATAGALAQPERAALLHGAAEALREASAVALGTLEQRDREQWLLPVRAALGEHGFAAAWAAGWALPLDEAIAAATAVVAPPWGVADDAAARSAAMTAGLTRREAEVLRLLVAGRSDKEIAEALFVTRRSASKYVSVILAKLRVPSRTAAARVAMRDGLV